MRITTFARGAVLSAALLGVIASPASAGEVNVSLNDESPPAVNGDCTLREAILEANSDIPQTSTDCHFTGSLGDDTVNVPAGTLQMKGGDFDVEVTTGHGLTVNGQGAGKTTIVGRGDQGLFFVSNNASSSVLGTRYVRMNGLTLTGGNAGRGGAVCMCEVEGDDSKLFLTNVNVTGNQAQKGGGIGLINATLDAKNSTFSQNRAISTFDAWGGAIAATVASNAETGPHQFGVKLDNSKVVNNSVVSVTGTGNRLHEGGGIEADGTNSNFGVVSIADSTIANNTLVAADSHDQLNGGGMVAYNVDFTMRNSTVSGNRLQTGHGSPSGNDGGVRFVDDDNQANTFNVVNSTFANNDAGPDGSGSAKSSVGGLRQSGGTGKIVNTTFTGNRATEVADFRSTTGNRFGGGGGQPNNVFVRGSIFADADACSGLKTAGDNIEVGDDTCNLDNPPGGSNPGDPAANGDRENVAVSALNLGELADNGGPTETAAPGTGSVAIGAIPAARCLDSDGTALGADQRGLARTDPCDAGSVEQTLCQGRAVDTIGTDGPDQIQGTSGDDVIEALGGDDVIAAGDGSDAVCAGDGDDQVDPGRDSDDDSVDGGAGTDLITYRSAANGVNADLGTGTATGNGTDTILGFEDLEGTDRADTLRGNNDPNRITGLLGTDSMQGLGGDDDLFARDGGSDTVNCGSGTDSAVLDIAGIDTVSGCEDAQVQEQPPPPPPAGGGAQPNGGGAQKPPVKRCKAKKKKKKGKKASLAKASRKCAKKKK